MTEVLERRRVWRREGRAAKPGDPHDQMTSPPAAWGGAAEEQLVAAAPLPCGAGSRMRGVDGPSVLGVLARLRPRQ